jgi:O-antigen ligase
MAEQGNRMQTYLDQLMQLVTEPEGLVLIGLGLCFTIAMLAFDRLFWVTLALALCTAAVTPPASDWYDLRLATPIHELAIFSRPLTVFLLVLLLLNGVRFTAPPRYRFIPVATVSLLILQTVVCTRLVVSPETLRGLLSFGVYVLLFLTLGVTLQRRLQTYSDLKRIVGCVVAAGAMLIALTIYQLAVNPSMINPAGRLFMTTANPQAAGIILGLFIPASTALLMLPGTTIAKRIGLLTLIVLAIIFVFWTGSRTSMLMVVIGVAVLFRARLGAGVVVICALALGVVAGLEIMSQSMTQGAIGGVERMVTAGNTRSDVWLDLINDFAANPVFGSLGGGYTIRENSYLAAAARFGLVGLVPMLFLVIMIFKQMVGLNRIRRQGGKELTVFCDLLIGSLAALGAGAMFEGLVFAVLHFWLFAAYMYFAAGSFLIDSVRIESATDSPAWAGTGHVAIQPNTGGQA